MTEVGTIVTLEDNKEYMILEETNKEGSRYVYAVRVLIDDTPTDEYTIFRTDNTPDGEYLLEVDDRELYDELIKDFQKIVAEKVLSD